MLAAVVVLLALILVALVALVVILLRRTRERPQGWEPTRPVDPFASVGEVAGDPRSLKAGDLIEYLGTRYFVRGSLRLREGGYTWSEHLLDADTIEGAKVWISVEEDPDLEVVWWT
ncbi:MAG: DUF4178 domain-containing protein, partial [Symbiobacteriaceae bacterium]